MSGSGHLVEWEGHPIADWRARWGVPAIVALAQTGSTNDIARRMAGQGAPAGLLVMTEYQTAGRGRMKRPWAGAPGRSLLFSIVLRPAGRDGASANLAPGTAPLRAGLAVAAALRTAAGVDARLKWPNDVVTQGGKLAGILCEAVTGTAGTVIITGIGINVLQQREEWPVELKEHAISLAQAGGTVAAARGAAEPPGQGSPIACGSTSAASSPVARPSLRAAVMDAVVAAMRPLFRRPLEPLDGDELRAYAAIDALRGLDVTVTGTSQIRGIASGIAADGALLIETAGTFQRVTSGTVRVASPPSHTTARKPR